MFHVDCDTRHARQDSIHPREGRMKARYNTLRFSPSVLASEVLILLSGCRPNHAMGSHQERCLVCRRRRSNICRSTCRRTTAGIPRRSPQDRSVTQSRLTNAATPHASTARMNHIAARADAHHRPSTQDCAPHPGTVVGCRSRTTGRRDIGHVHGLDSHGWWLPAAFVTPAWTCTRGALVPQRAQRIGMGQRAGARSTVPLMAVQRRVSDANHCAYDAMYKRRTESAPVVNDGPRSPGTPQPRPRHSICLRAACRTPTASAEEHD